MTEPEYEYGVCWEFSNGMTYIGENYTQRGAEQQLRVSADPKANDPHATGLVRRPVAAWSPVPLLVPEGKQATK